MSDFFGSSVDWTDSLNTSRSNIAMDTIDKYLNASVTCIKDCSDISRLKCNDIKGPEMFEIYYSYSMRSKSPSRLIVAAAIIYYFIHSTQYLLPNGWTSEGSDKSVVYVHNNISIPFQNSKIISDDSESSCDSNSSEHDPLIDENNKRSGFGGIVSIFVFIIVLVIIALIAIFATSYRRSDSKYTR